MKKREDLSDFERYVIEDAGTEPAFSGQFTFTVADGTYVCKRCEQPLFRSEDKFDSGCGWPSFDDEIENAVLRRPDPDGMRTEIVCNHCRAHLGHVFEGEGKTPKNLRHCVNSVSISFHKADQVQQAKAIFASGCFWGTEYFLSRCPGVVSTRVGYTGGQLENPTYEQVCSKETGHVEAVEVTYDPSKTSYEALLRLFFETHNFSQKDGQGPDIGPQYKSVIFVSDQDQKKQAEATIDWLLKHNYEVATQIKPETMFWCAEDYHQSYYERKGEQPYCHRYRKIF